MTERWTTRSTNWIRAAASLWLLAIMLPSLTHLWGSPLGALAYLFFRPVCHQLPERSFHLWGSQLAVCHRCLGIYVGVWLGLFVLPEFRRLHNALLRQPRLLGLFALPMLLNVMTPNWPVDRFLTGLVAGFPVSIFVVIAMQQFFHSHFRRSQ